MPSLISMLNSAPNVPLYDAINRLYPYKIFLPKEGISSVEDTLETFQLQSGSSTLSKILNQPSSEPKSGTLKVKVGNVAHDIQVPIGSQYRKESETGGKYVETAYHESLLAELLLSHSAHDFCIIGPKGCGKVNSGLGSEVEYHFSGFGFNFVAYRKFCSLKVFRKQSVKIVKIGLLANPGERTGILHA